MAAIPCATYQAGNIHSKMRRRHKSDSDVTPALSRPFTPLAGLASESGTSSASGSPAVPSSPTVSGSGTFFGGFFHLSQKMKTLTDSWTSGLNNKTEAPCQNKSASNPALATTPSQTKQ